MTWEETDDYIRSGHGKLEEFDSDSFRTIIIDEDKGIKAVIGCPKGEWRNNKCEANTEVTSFLFSKEKEWNMKKAKKWFKEHEDDR